MGKRCFGIFLLLMISCVARVNAQQNDFEPGWYITLQNDTLKGLLSKDKKDKFTSFYFRDNAKSPVAHVVISDVKSINIDGQLYKTWFGKRNMEYIDRVDLSLIKNDGVYYTDTIVLKCIYTGQDFCLYNYKDEKDHFFVEAKDRFDELLLTYDYLSYWERLNLRSFQFPAYWVHNIYKSQIMAMFGEKLDRRTHALIDRTELDKYSLLRLCRTLDEL